MKSLYILSLLLLYSSCSVKQDSKNQKKSTLTENSTVFDRAYENVFDKKKYEQGKDTLEYYLGNQKYDSSLYYSYHALAYAYIHLYDFEKADSVISLVDRSELNNEEEVEYLQDAAEVSMQLGNYDKAKKYLFQLHHHPGRETPIWIQDNTFLHMMWLVNSLMSECDSSKFYLIRYIDSLEKLKQIREWQGIDSTKMNYFKSQIQDSCPLIDSVGLNLPVIVVHK